VNVLETAASKGSNLGAHIHTIFVEIEEEECYEYRSVQYNVQDFNRNGYTQCPLSSRISYDIIHLVCQAIHLRSFSMRNPCRPSLLLMLCATSISSTLCSLEIVLDILWTPNEVLVAVPASINCLRNLKELVLECYNDWPNLTTHGLCLPELRSFTLRGMYENKGACVDFLDRCHLDRLLNLDIILESTEMRAERVHSIRRLVERLPLLESLALKIPTHILLLLLPDLSTHIAVLDISRMDCSEEMIPMIPPSVRRICVSAVGSAHDSLWPMLKQLVTEQTNIQTVCVGIWTSQGVVAFTWKDSLAALTAPRHDDPDLVDITGRLLAYSWELSRKGIRLLDGENCAASLSVHASDL
jgi:hypothetical protein